MPIANYSFSTSIRYLIIKYQQTDMSSKNTTYSMEIEPE